MSYTIQKGVSGLSMLFLAILFNETMLSGAADMQNSQPPVRYIASLKELALHAEIDAIIDVCAPCASKDPKICWGGFCDCRTGKRCRVKAGIAKALVPLFADNALAILRLEELLERKYLFSWEELQEHDLQHIIYSLLELSDSSDPQFETIVYNRFAQAVAKSYLLNQSCRKTERTPEKLPEFLQKHFTGL